MQSNNKRIFIMSCLIASGFYVGASIVNAIFQALFTLVQGSGSVTEGLFYNGGLNYARIILFFAVGTILHALAARESSKIIVKKYVKSNQLSVKMFSRIGICFTIVWSILSPLFGNNSGWFYPMIEGICFYYFAKKYYSEALYDTEDGEISQNATLNCLDVDLDGQSIIKDDSTNTNSNRYQYYSADELINAILKIDKKKIDSKERKVLMYIFKEKYQKKSTEKEDADRLEELLASLVELEINDINVVLRKEINSFYYDMAKDYSDNDLFGAIGNILDYQPDAQYEIIREYYNRFFDNHSETSMESQTKFDTHIMKPKFCRKCGKNLNEQINFCPYCGIKIIEVLDCLQHEEKVDQSKTEQNDMKIKGSYKYSNKRILLDSSMENCETCFSKYLIDLESLYNQKEYTNVVDKAEELEKKYSLSNSDIDSKVLCFDSLEKFKLFIHTNMDTIDYDIIWYAEELGKIKYYKGLAFLKLDDYENAKDAFEDAHNISPADTGIADEYITKLLEFKEYDNAKNVIVDSLKYCLYQDEYARLYRNLGRLYTEKGFLDLSEACYGWSMRFEDNAEALNRIYYIEINRKGHSQEEAEKTVQMILRPEYLRIILDSNRIPIMISDIIPELLKDESNLKGSKAIALYKEMGIINEVQK